jgi:peptide subunit release factor 1 (eRF1)
MKKAIKELDEMTGNGTSMITLIIPSTQLLRASKILADEYQVAANIKSRV